MSSQMKERTGLADIRLLSSLSIFDVGIYVMFSSTTHYSFFTQIHQSGKEFFNEDC